VVIRTNELVARLIRERERSVFERSGCHSKNIPLPLIESCYYGMELKER
jgi:hypothetical protein